MQDQIPSEREAWGGDAGSLAPSERELAGRQARLREFAFVRLYIVILFFTAPMKNE